jgi:E1A/CREB-binding protein
MMGGMNMNMGMPNPYGMVPSGPMGGAPGGMVPSSAGGMVPMGGGGGMVPVNGGPMGVGMMQMGGPGGMMGPLGGMPGMMPAPGGSFPPPAQLPPGGAMGGMPAVADTASSQQGQPGNPQMQGRTQYIQKQQRWLLFLRHCAKCTQTEQECQFSRSCRVGKELWQHILQCTNVKCAYPRCVSSKDLLKHHQKCQVGRGGSLQRAGMGSRAAACLQLLVGP